MAPVSKGRLGKWLLHKTLQPCLFYSIFVRAILMVTWTKCFSNYAQDANEWETMICSKQETGWTAPQTALEHSALQSEDI